MNEYLKILNEDNLPELIRLIIIKNLTRDDILLILSTIRWLGVT